MFENTISLIQASSGLLPVMNGARAHYTIEGVISKGHMAGFPFFNLNNVKELGICHILLGFGYHRG